MSAPAPAGGRVESETELIQTYLEPLTGGLAGAFGLADDAALLPREPGRDLVISSDPIIAGVHFFADDNASDIAWKALAVNVSDLAAKSAKPVAYILTLALPEAPERAWMAAFAKGLRKAQEAFGCTLIGGDTDRTPGPLTIGVTVIGSVPEGGFVKRQGVAAGDHVFVTGTIGDAALGLRIRRDPSAFASALSAEDRDHLLRCYLRPRPCLALADALRAHASAALDISDGLLKDLGRLAGSHGITVGLDSLPLSAAVRAALDADPSLAATILGGGDDYQLLVAVSPQKAAAFAEAASRSAAGVTELGILAQDGPVCAVDAAGAVIAGGEAGYEHFSHRK